MLRRAVVHGGPAGPRRADARPARREVRAWHRARSRRAAVRGAAIDQETGEILDPEFVGNLDLLEHDPEGRLVVVDLKTSARKYTNLQVETALQLSVYSYAVGLSPFVNGDDVRLPFDVLTKTKQPELHRYWMARDRAANARLFRLVAEVLRAIAAEVFHAGRRVAVQGVPVPEPLLGVGVRRPGGGIPPAPQPP